MRLEKDIKTIFIDNEKPIFWCKQCHGTDVIYNLSFSEVLLIIIIFTTSHRFLMFGLTAYCLHSQLSVDSCTFF